MIKSMTGFGRAEAVSRERKVSVELKSVNHRYLDLNIKMPKRLSYFEGEIRNVMKTYIRRGKVDVFITYEDYTMGGMALPHILLPPESVPVRYGHLENVPLHCRARLSFLLVRYLLSAES